MIKHVVFFKFKADATPSDRKAALDGLKELPGKIDVIRSFEIGENVVASPRAWDVVLIGEYDNLEALDVYIRHEAHVQAATLVRGLCESVGSVDYEF